MELKEDQRDPNRFYVYALVDPRDNEAFYIGKGSGRRVKHHARDARLFKQDNAAKIVTIQSIWACGMEVVEVIIDEHLSEREALRLEREYIAALRDQLTNIACGGRAQSPEAKLEAFVAGAKGLLARMVPYEEWLRKKHRSDSACEVYLSSEEWLLKIVAPGYQFPKPKNLTAG